MWIRTQNKERLINADNLFLEKYTNYYNVDTYYIKATTNSENISLGYYSAKEKAFKVLDMIERQINTIGLLKTDKIGNKINYYVEDNKTIATKDNVFQMPQDDEVE